MNPADGPAEEPAIDRLAERLASLDDTLGGHRPDADPTAPTPDVGRRPGDPDRVEPDDVDLILLLNQAGAGHRRGLGEKALPPPSRVGRFLLVREVGRGGFATVHEAIDTRLHRRVALKIAHAGARISPQALRRFVREAELAARVVHPHVVTIHDVGEEDGTAFIAEEFCDGGNLDEWLERRPGPLDPRTAAAIVRAIAWGLHAAHGCGVTHRDIKPANILLATATAAPILPGAGNGGFDVKLGDFGLGKLAADALAADRLTQLSRAGDRVGTLVWMAPEQTDSAIGPTGPLTDIHALGLVLDRMLTGRCRQAGESEAETLRLILLEEPQPPDAVVRAVPADLAAVCLKCLAKSPAERYASAAELAVDLSRFLDGRPTVARPLGPAARVVRAARRQPLLFGSVAAAVVAAAIGALLWLDLSGKRAQIRRGEAELRFHEAAGELRLAFESWRTGDVAGALAHLGTCRSIDAALADSLAGRWLVRRSRGERRRLLDLRADGTAAAGRPADLYVLAVSPDGSRLAAGRADGVLSLARWPAVGAAAEWLHLPAHDEINDVAFAPDGALLATVGQDGAVQVRSSGDGGLVSSPCPTGPPLFAVAFSPDGTRLAWGGEERRVFVTDTATGAIASFAPFDQPDAQAPRDDGDIESIVWIDGGRIAVSCGRRAVVARVADGGIEREFEGLSGIVGHLDLSPDRRRLLCAGTSVEPCVVEVESGSVACRLATHPNWVQGGVFSPDGTTIVTGCKDGVIRRFDAATGELLGSFVGHAGRLWDVRFGPRGELVSAGSDGTIREWDLAAPPASRGAITAPLPAQEIVDASIWEGPADFFPDRPPGETIAILAPRAGAMLAVALPSARVAVVADRSIGTGNVIAALPPRVAIVDFQSLRVTAPGNDPGALREIDGRWWSCAWLPDGRLLAGAWTGDVHLFEAGLASSRLIDRFDRPVKHFDLGGPARDRLAIGAGGEIRIHSLGDSSAAAAASGKSLLAPPLVAERVVKVAWAPDAMSIAYGTNHGTVRIVDAASGAPRGAFPHHAAEVRGVRFSRDGRILVSCDAESVRITDIATTAVLDEIRPGWTIGTFALVPDPSGTVDAGLLVVGGARPGNGPADARLLWLDLGPPTAD